MSAATAVLSVQKPNALLAIFVCGLLAGILDLGSAFITYGAGVPRVIAAGLLGPTAVHGGLGPYVLGIALQFFISTSAAAVYYAASRKLSFLREHALVWKLRQSPRVTKLYGVAVFLVMNLIVVPLSALHLRGPFQLAGLIQGLLVHMFLIGLPISLSVRQYAK